MKRFVPVLLPLALGACSIVNGYPAQPDNLPTTVTSLDPKTLNNLVTEYNNNATAEERKKAIRNQIIFSDISQIDKNFNSFKSDLNSQENILRLGTDFIGLALAGLGATIPGAGTKAALAAASAGVIGANAAIDKDVLYQKTIIALVTEMEAQRSQEFAKIITNTNSDTTKYPLEFASKDLQDYYQAGTLVNALEGVNQSASTKAQTGKNQVAAALSAQYNYTNLSKKIESYWIPDGKTVNTPNEQKINACMTQKNIVGSIPFLINGGTEGDKAAIISCLGI